jgi:hypothetical protein
MIAAPLYYYINTFRNAENVITVKIYPSVDTTATAIADAAVATSALSVHRYI